MVTTAAAAGAVAATPSRVAAADNGAALIRQAAALETQRRFESAALVYQKAADAFEREGNAAQRARALGRSAAMYEKQADAVTGAPAAPSTLPRASRPRAVVAATNPPAASSGESIDGFHVGDEVLVSYMGAKYPARIVKLAANGGQNFNARVHYLTVGPQGASFPEVWTGTGLLEHANVKAAIRDQQAAVQAGPRPGRYKIYSFGAPGNMLYLGYFDLAAGGRYTLSNPGASGPIGSGTYVYNAAGHAVHWSSGPLRQYGPSADFEVHGVRHQLRLRSGTIAANDPA